MTHENFVRKIIFIFAAFLLVSINIFPQGVTSASLSGKVVDKDGNALPAATILALHTPSGTQYGTTSRDDGKFNIFGMRVGGPYSVTVSYVGFKSQVRENISLNLGITTNVDFTLAPANIELGEVTVSDKRDNIFSSERTGSSTSINADELKVLPTISRRIDDFTRLTPQASGSSFAGQDNRLNNITVDGSYFNNSFGLSGQPGDRTGVAPISIDAIEQVQVSIAPFDVRQGNFVGAGVNTVTRSGTNEFSGSAYYQYRHQGLVGTEADANAFDPGRFKYNQIGLRLGGPIMKNKLFFFASFESDQLTQPGTTFKSNPGGATVGGSMTRVLKSDLDALSTFLRTKFNYETGPYEGYDHETPALRFLMRLDYNLDDRNKISLRYTHLDSETDVLLSNSSSLGFGGRRSNTTGLNFQNSNYMIMENIRSIVGEWNTSFSDNMVNNLIVGYTSNDESRDSRGTLFPMVDILNSGSVYTTFGFEPFTPNNELRYWSFQLQDNFTMYMKDHLLTFGVSFERYESENVFFPGSQSAYVYNDLDDFYADANGYLANPARTQSDSTLRRFQVRWSNIPGQTKPVQPLEVNYLGAYAQDEWNIMKNLKLTAGIRVDVPMFGETGFKNDSVATKTFKDETGAAVKYATEKLPDANILFSPRVGFNWDVFNNKTTQVRGGTGVFTGKPAYVWISNQIGENGVLTGFEQKDNTKDRPFNPDINRYKQTTVTGAPASSYGLAFTDPSFKFPQVWRTNIGVDQKLPFDLVATAEFLYGKDLNGIYYINANLSSPNTAFVGVDNRPRWTVSNRLNSNVTSAVVMKNQDVGSSTNLSFSLEKPFSNNWFAKVGYNYNVAENTIDPGSIAFGSWNNNAHSGDPNNPGVGYSDYRTGNRIFAAGAYKFEYFNFGSTTVSLFWEGAHAGITEFNPLAKSTSYVFSGDLNGDGGTSNDLIYIHADKSEMNFEQYTSGGVTYTAAQQADAWDQFIESDDYLKENRGKYAVRGGVMLPMIFRADLSITQEFYGEFIGKKNALEFRLDVLNVGNLINKEWGVAERLVTTSPLTNPGADANGKVKYRLRAVNSQLITKSTEKSATIFDVYRIQLGVRYIFN